MIRSTTFAAIVSGIAAASFFIGGGVANAIHQAPSEMTVGEAQAHAAELTGHLMICWGDPKGWVCAPNTGESSPVVTCLHGVCQ